MGSPGNGNKFTRGTKQRLDGDDALRVCPLHDWLKHKRQLSFRKGGCQPDLDCPSPACNHCHLRCEQFTGRARGI
jgi:hypothetical protein